MESATQFALKGSSKVEIAASHAMLSAQRVIVSTSALLATKMTRLSSLMVGAWLSALSTLKEL